MFNDITCPIVARKQLGDNVSNREVYATIRNILNKDGDAIDRVEACIRFVRNLELVSATTLNFISKSNVTTSKFIEVASKWYDYNDLRRLSQIIGADAYAHRIVAEIYEGRHKQIADTLLTQKNIDAEWITVAKILISLDKLSTLNQVIEKMPYCVVIKLLDVEYYVPVAVREMVIQRYLFEEHGIVLEIKNTYIGPHPTISHYYPEYKNGVLCIFDSSYPSGRHNYHIGYSIALDSDKSILEIIFSADKWDKGYKYNTYRRTKFIFKINEKTLYKETKKGLVKVSNGA